MAKSNYHGGGPFDPPSGQAHLETPDGVTCTFGSGEVKNSLTNADWACGGPDGGGYGAFTKHNADGTNTASVFAGPGRNPDKFRIG